MRLPLEAFVAQDNADALTRERIGGG